MFIIHMIGNIYIQYPQIWNLYMNNTDNFDVDNVNYSITGINEMLLLSTISVRTTLLSVVIFSEISILSKIKCMYDIS